MNIFISHAISVGLTVLMIAALVLSLNSASEEWKNFLGDFEPKHVCLALENAVEDLYSPSDLNTTSVLGDILVNLPEKTAGSDYSIKFVNQSIFVMSKKNYNCTVISDVDLKGDAHGSNVRLEFRGPNVIEIKDI